MQVKIVMSFDTAFQARNLLSFLSRSLTLSVNQIRESSEKEQKLVSEIRIEGGSCSYNLTK
jgi:hypothetical protein